MLKEFSFRKVGDFFFPRFDPLLGDHVPPTVVPASSNVKRPLNPVQASLKRIEEVRSLKTKERWFVFFAMLCGFCISAEYGITRPASHAIFLTTFSSLGIPWLWMATVPLNFIAIYLYNRFLPKLGSFRMWIAVSLVVVLVNSIAGLVLPVYPEFIFLQCMWKDIYILLMFKQLWSMIHVTIHPQRTKYLYGLIFAMGTIGSCVGSTIPSLAALSMGSETLFFFTLPLYSLLYWAFTKAFSCSLMTRGSFKKEMMDNPSASEGVSLIRRNRILMAILLLVVAMQVSAGFMEFRFNAYLENAIVDKDLRTSYYGQLFGLTNFLSVGLQAVGSFVVIHWLGLRKTHLLIPFILLGSALCSWIIPTFGFISFSYVIMKAIDFSLFSVSREMLYIPFGLDEKFRAKAVIDVFAYRSSKALVSLSILALQAVSGIYLLEVASYVSLSIFVLWISIVFFMLRHEQYGYRS